MSQTSPVYGNQFFKQVQNVAGTNVQTLNADNVKTTNLKATELQVTTALHVPVQNTGPTGPATAGQVVLLNYPEGTYVLYVFNGTSWVPAN